MAKETTKKTVKKATAPAKEKEPKKKNPLLDADEDTSTEEDTDVEETTDEDASEEADEEEVEDDADDSEEEEEVEEKPVKKAPAKTASTAAKPKVNVADEAMSDIRTTKQILDAEEQVQFFVPLFEGEKPGAVHDCFINGHKVSVKKGIMTKVPASVAALLADHYKITAEAGADFRLDRNADKQNALG